MIRKFLFLFFFFLGVSIISIIFLPSLIMPNKVVLFGGKMMGRWAALCLQIILQTKNQVNIAIIGKYIELKDAYKSLDEALTHGGIENNTKVNLVRIDSEKLELSEIPKKLRNISGILIPGGCGKRGTNGKIAAIKYARNNKIPFLGICYGMQMAITVSYTHLTLPTR